MNPQQLQYVIITPAKNEEAFLEPLIACMAAQTRLPLRWVIVSDGSTDRTDEIASRAAAEYPWIEFLRMPERRERHFGGKVNGFNAGRERIEHLPYHVIGCMDADLTFEPDYFEFLLGKFAADPKLGLGGTPFAEEGRTYDYRFSSTEHVSGACQVFRRECFDAIGGYVPLEGGGIDDVANIMSKMKGWRVQTFIEKHTDHHRPMGSANRGRFASSMHAGARAYVLGWHPLWQVFRSLYQMTRPPYFTGGIALFIGYMQAFLAREPRIVPQEAIEFQRRDQMRRLRATFGMGARP